MNTVLCLVIVAVCGMTLCQAATTTRHPHHTHGTGGHHHHNGTGPTREPAEKETLSFYYMPKLGKMFIHAGTKCYIATLTDAEKMDVHTDAGLRTLELKFIQMLSTATQVQPTTVDAADAHACGKRATEWYTIP